jgi:hypothetical protein
MVGRWVLTKHENEQQTMCILKARVVESFVDEALAVEFTRTPGIHSR